MGNNKSDDNLQKQVTPVIENDKNLHGYGLHTDVTEGEVQLQGIVDTLQEKKRAERLARQTLGVKRVDNAISISTDGAITDQDVIMEVNEELQTAGVDLHDIGAETAGGHGTVILRGKTDDPAKVEEAMEATAKARGVTRVLNQVKLGEEELTLADIFHSQVNNDQEE